MIFSSFEKNYDNNNKIPSLLLNDQFLKSRTDKISVLES